MKDLTMKFKNLITILAIMIAVASLTVSGCLASGDQTTPTVKTPAPTKAPTTAPAEVPTAAPPPEHDAASTTKPTKAPTLKPTAVPTTESTKAPTVEVTSNDILIANPPESFGQFFPPQAEGPIWLYIMLGMEGPMGG